MEHINTHCEQNVGDFPVNAIGTVHVLTLCYMVKVKVKKSRYKPGVAQRVPGS